MAENVLTDCGIAALCRTARKFNRLDGHLGVETRPLWGDSWAEWICLAMLFVSMLWMALGGYRV